MKTRTKIKLLNKWFDYWHSKYQTTMDEKYIDKMYGVVKRFNDVGIKQIVIPNKTSYLFEAIDGKRYAGYGSYIDTTMAAMVERMSEVALIIDEKPFIHLELIRDIAICTPTPEGYTVDLICPSFTARGKNDSENIAWLVTELYKYRS